MKTQERGGKSQQIIEFKYVIKGHPWDRSKLASCSLCQCLNSRQVSEFMKLVQMYRQENRKIFEYIALQLVGTRCLKACVRAKVQKRSHLIISKLELRICQDLWLQLCHLSRLEVQANSLPPLRQPRQPHSSTSVVPNQQQAIYTLQPNSHFPLPFLNVFGAPPATGTQPKLNFGAPTATTQPPSGTTPALNLGQPAPATQPTTAPPSQPTLTFNAPGTNSQSTNAQSQPQLPSQQAQVKEKPLQLKSARFVLTKIQGYLQQANFQGLSAFLRAEPDLQSHLGQALLHYKPTNQDSRKKLTDPANPLKWGGKDILSIRLANELVIKLSDTLNLDEMLTFELIETFFATSDQTRKTFVYLITIDQNIFQAENQIQQQSHIMIQNTQLMQQKLRNIEAWKREFSSVSNQVFQEAQLVYLQERVSLLHSILALLNIKSATPQAQPVLQFVKDLLTKEHLESHLLSSLVRNSEQQDNFSGFTCSLREVTLGLQREELAIMHILARLYLQGEVVPKNEAFTKFIKYQQGTRFQGLRLRPQNYQSDETLALNQRKITSLSVQICFAFMSIGQLCKPNPDKNGTLKQYLSALLEKPQAFLDLNKLIEEAIGVEDPIVAIIYLTWINMLQTVQKLNLGRAFGLSLEPLKQVDHNKFLPKLLSQANAWMAFISEMKEVDEQFEEEAIAQTGGISQSGEQRDDLQLLLQDWLCLIFPFLKEHRLEEAICTAQDVTFEVISSPGHLQHVWKQIESNPHGTLFRPAIMGAQFTVCNTLEIFENILANPVDSQNFGRFLILLRALIGNKRQQYAANLVKLLQSIKLSKVATIQQIRSPPQSLSGRPLEANPEWSLMQYLHWVLFENTDYLEGATDKHLSEYMNLVTLFALIIKQNYLLYLELNQSDAIPLYHDLEQSDHDLSQPSIEEHPSDRHFYREDFLKVKQPLLLNLMKAFMTLIHHVTPSQAVLPLKSLMHAFTTIYRNLPLQPELLGWMNAFLDSSGIPSIVTFFTFNLHEHEYPANTYALTRAYLGLVEVIFNKDASRDYTYYLSYEYRINLSESVCAKYLVHVYQTLLTNFGQLTFKDMKDFLKLYKSLLKVTDNLLSRFRDQLPNMKAPLAQRYPNYDETLRFISSLLNSEINLEFLLINALMLQEENLRGTTSGITNKFWLNHLKQSTVSHLEDSKTRTRVQKLVTQSLKCLNTLVELAQMQSAYDNLSVDEKVNVGPRMHYLSKLSLVSNIANLVKNPGQWEMYSVTLANGGSVQYSLFGIIQYYIKPHIHLCPFLTQLQIEAVRFLSLCCTLWSTQPLGQRVSLESTLRTAGVTSQDNRARYIQNLKFACKQLDKPIPLRYLSAFLDLLLVATGTQGQWVSELFKEQEFSQTVLDSMIRKSIRIESKQDRKPENRAFAQQVETRLIMLLAEMSSHRVAEQFFKKMDENDDYSKLYNNVVSPLAEDSVKQVVVDYSGVISHFRLESDSISSANLSRTLTHTSVCSALVALRYYMRLLAEEYQRDLHSQSVKKALRLFFENNNIMKALRPSLSALPYMQDLTQLNGLIQQVSADARGSKILRDYMMSVEGNKLSQEQLDMMNSVACKVINASQECTIALQNLECLGFLTQLKRETHPYRLIGSSQFGTLGHEFYVNTEELRLTARAYFYDDDQWLAEIQQHSAQYNMALSYTYAQQLFLVGHRDLVLAVGKTRLRESVRQRELVLGNHALATSLFNLVVQDDVKDVVKNAGVRDGTQNRLAKLILEVASPLCARYKQDKLGGDAEMSDSILAFDVQQGEIELDYLGILLGALNTVSECDDFQVETLKQMDNQVLVPLIKALPRVRSQQKLHQALSESAQNRLEVERRSAQLYITLVLQLFSLSVQVQMKVGQQVGAPSTNTEQDYMRVLADIVKIMGTQESNFLVGLKILEQGFGLLSPQNVSVFMKRQENPPIKVILSRYNSTNATIEERVRIIEFFVTYCRVEDGAEHLRSESLLKSLSLGSLMTAMNDADFYLTETPTSEPKRNPLHILWCHTLLLIRTLNHMLLPLSQEHRRLIPTELSLIWTRLTALLGFGQALREQRFDSKSLSLALYEEMELMTGVVGQYMEYADEMQAGDWDRFVEVKDKILFGVVALFTEDRNISQNSSTEQYLLRMTHDKMQLGVLKQGAYSGLDLASDTLKVKIVFNTMSSLLNLNMLNENKASKQDFINTWDPTARLQAKNNDSRKSYYGENQYATDFDTGQALTNISLATHSLLQALTKLGDNFKLWLGSEALLSQLYDNVFSLFRNDDWINSEYMGLNTFIAGHTFADILEQYEQSLQMGYLSAAMFLKKLKEQYETSDFGGYQNILMNGQPINIKLINEHGDRIIEHTKVLEAEIVRNGKIKSSVDHGYNQKIEEFIRGLRENPYDYGGGGFMSKSRSKYGGASAYK